MKSPTDAKDSWRIALDYQLQYELRYSGSPGSYRYQRVVRTKSLIERMLAKASVGAMSREMFLEIRNALNTVEHGIARDAYFTNVHSTVITTEWLDAMGDQLRGKTVLEVGAHRGCLTIPMNKRGIRWVSVQTDPDPDCVIRPIPVTNYAKAVRSYRDSADWVFMSWPALGMDEGAMMDVIRQSLKLGIPVMINAENRQRKSAHLDLWEGQHTHGYRVIRAADCCQTVRWRGLRDVIWLVLGKTHLREGQKKGEPGDIRRG